MIGTPLSDSHETWKCTNQELERQIRCFPYVELSDIHGYSKSKKAVGRQRNLWLHLYIGINYFLTLVLNIIMFLNSDIYIKVISG
jgi:hypothetical protein